MSREILLLILLPLALAGCAGRGPQPPPLEVAPLQADQQGPRAVQEAPIRWTAEARGGVGDLSYEFRMGFRGLEIVEQQGKSPSWEWSPAKPGNYRLKVIVRDAAGRQADSGWTVYAITPPVHRGSPLTLLPVENLSGSVVPLDRIEEALQEKLAQEGFNLLPDEVLAELMKKHRIRYTGGVSAATARALQEEAGVEAVLITSVEAYQEANPPQLSLIARLVQTGDQPAILWMDSVGFTGEDNVGLLGLGRIGDSRRLLDNALDFLTASLLDYLDGSPPATGGPAGTAGTGGLPALARGEAVEKGLKKKYLPRSFFRSPIISTDQRYGIAVIPFLNRTDRKNAGFILGLQFVQQLLHHPLITVVEPGVVREELLRFRAMMEAGPSLALADLLTSRNSLGVELVLSGEVFDYQSTAKTPKVDFSARVLERDSREIVCNSRSFNQGDDGVNFFDFGRVHTAQELTREMTRAVLNLLFR